MRMIVWLVYEWRPARPDRAYVRMRPGWSLLLSAVRRLGLYKHHVSSSFGLSREYIDRKEKAPAFDAGVGVRRRGCSSPGKIRLFMFL